MKSTICLAAILFAQLGKAGIDLGILGCPPVTVLGQKNVVLGIVLDVLGERRRCECQCRDTEQEGLCS